MGLCKRILVTTAMLVLTAGCAAAQTAQNGVEKPDKAEILFQDGRKAMLTGNHAKAIKLLSQAVRAEPAKTGYRLYLARSYQYAGKSDQAEKHLQIILKSTPGHVEAGQLLGRIYSDAEKWKEVVAVLDPLLRYRHDYTTYHMLAEARYNLGDHDKARKHFEEAIKLNASSGMDHYQLGNIYLAGNFFALATESYQRALSLGIDSPSLRYKLGSAYFNLRNHFGRIAIITVKAGKPGMISGQWYLIEKVPGKKDTFRAAPSISAIYQIARAIDNGIKDRPDIHFLRANIYLNAHRYKQAYGMFGKIEDTVPKEDLAMFYYYYSQAAFGVGQYDHYLSLLGKAIKLDKPAYEATLVEAYQKVAEQYNQAGDLDKYIVFLRKAVEASPQTASLHLKLGNAYEETTQYLKAILQWRLVLDLEPDHPQRMKLLNLISKYRQIKNDA